MDEVFIGEALERLHVLVFTRFPEELQSVFVSFAHFVKTVFLGFSCGQ